MASIVKIKRSSVQGKAPTVSDLQAGELALNTRDGKLFSSDGSAVFEVGANTTTISVGTLTVGNTNAYTLPTSDGTENQALLTDGNGNLRFATPIADYDRDGFTSAIHYVTAKIIRDNIDFGLVTETYTADVFNEEDTSFPVFELNEPLGRTVTLDFGEIS